MAEGNALLLSDFDDSALRELVSDLYHIFLRRPPDEAGFNHRLEQLRAGLPLADIISTFATCDEYAARMVREFRSSAGISEDSLGEFPEDYRPPGEAGRGYLRRLYTGFLQKYCSGPVVLDVGYSGYNNPEGKAALPNAIGVDLDYPGYDGIRLPFDDSSVDTVFSSHCLEHILADHAAMRDWYRVLKVGGFIVCIVPSQALYEKRRFLPSRWNADHKRFYTPASLVASFEAALSVNSFRVRHLAENDSGYNYSIGPDEHAEGAYEIELVVEKINRPRWELAT